MYNNRSRFHEFGPFRLDLGRRLLFRQDQVIPLTPKVLHTLLVLVENSGRVVSKDELMKAVWPDTFVEEGNLTQNISTLRKVLGEHAGDHTYIETVPKQGYRFIDLRLPETDTAATRAWFRRSRGLIWSGVLSVACVIAVGTGWHVRSGATVGLPVTVTPLTSYGGLELHPSLAPDGNQVAFAWDGEKRDNLDIYVKVVGSDGSLRLTADAAQDFRPAWSPNGRWIAFLRAADGLKTSVLRIRPTGGPEQKIGVVDAGDMSGFDWAPLLEWTPDGKWLLTRERVPPDEAASLFLISVESGEKKRLTFPPPNFHGDLTAEISADGRTLAFSRTRSGTLGNVCTLALSSGYVPTGEPKCFAISDLRLANLGSIRWFPNRHEVMFSPLFRGSGRSSLWRMPMPRRAGAVGVPQRFPIPTDSARDPAISRDGRRVVYSDFRVDADIWRLDLQNPRAGPVKLIASTKYDHAAAFSPDGKKIVFISDRSGDPAVWVADHDGSNQTRLTTRQFPLAGMPRWSPTRSASFLTRLLTSTSSCI